MAFKGFNEETLTALASQGGTTDESKVAPETQETVPEGDLPDINLVDVKPEESGDEAKEAAELAAKEKAKADAEAKSKEEKAQKEKDSDGEKTDVDFNSDEEVNKVLKDADFDINEVKSQIIKDGGISDELKAKLKANINPGLVDAYVETFEKQVAESKEEPKTTPDAEQAAKDKAQLTMNKFIYDSVGGEETFGKLAKALQANTDKETVGKINAKLASTNQALVKEGLQDAVNAYNKITGRGTNRMEGDSNTDQESNQFTFVTKDDYQKVIVSEKYKTDPVFAKQIDANRLKSINLDKQQTMPGQYRNIREGKMYNL